MSFTGNSALVLLIAALFSTLSCKTIFQSAAQTNRPIFAVAEKPKTVEIESSSIKKLMESAVEQTALTKSYDPNYTVLAYPMGDVNRRKIFFNRTPIFKFNFSADDRLNS